MKIKEGKYLIYTDGSCYKNTGGWGFVVIGSDYSYKSYGGIINCTNQQAELLAAIMALRLFSNKCELTIITDSKYLCDGMNLSLVKWKNNGYRTVTGKALKNRILWEHLAYLQKKKRPNWKWVKGHNGNVYNEIADELATKGRLFAAKEDTSLIQTTLHNLCNVKESITGTKILIRKHKGVFKNKPYIIQERCSG